MTTVLVTGGGARLDEVVAAVTDTGAEVVSVDSLDRLGEAVSGRTFDAYVQLPVAMTPRQGSLVSRVESFLTEGLLSRFRAAATGARASAMPSGDPASEETIGKAYADWRTEALGLMRVEF